MRTVPLGRSGLTVSRLGLGLAALGRPGYINLGHAADLAHDYDVASMRERAHAVLDAAWRGGVRYFDAARSYGRAEEFLATWLHGAAIAPADVTVGSKWGYTYTAAWQVERRAARGQGSLARHAPAPARQRPARCSATISISTRSTRRRWRAASSTTATCSTSSRGCARRRQRSASRSAGPRQADDDAARAGGRGRRRARLRHRAGDLEPARALGRAGAARRARGRPAA